MNQMILTLCDNCNTLLSRIPGVCKECGLTTTVKRYVVDMDKVKYIQREGYCIIKLNELSPEELLNVVRLM